MKTSALIILLALALPVTAQKLPAPGVQTVLSEAPASVSLPARD